MGGAVRLDIGCGHKREAGWVRVDFAVDRKKVTSTSVTTEGRALDPDIPCDIRAIPLPDDYADEARAIHVIEHFQVWEARQVLQEWMRVLRPGGVLAIECPCLDKIIKLFDVPGIPPYMTYWGLYGDPRMQDPLMMHHWCYTEAFLLKTMAEAGLENLRGQPPRFHQPARDMRIIGTKPAPEHRIELAR